jgi:dedicator of cytokinesis protein 3
VFEASGGDTAFRSKVNSFLNDLEAFLDLLLSLKDLPDSAEWTDERAGTTLRLMDFIRRIGREDMYIAHVHQLVQSNVDNEDWLAAGLALKLHADLYQWTTDGDVVEAFEYGKFDLPPQTQFARKESLYYLILDYLGTSNQRSQLTQTRSSRSVRDRD